MSESVGITRPCFAGDGQIGQKAPQSFFPVLPTNSPCSVMSVRHFDLMLSSLQSLMEKPGKEWEQLIPEDGILHLQNGLQNSLDNASVGGALLVQQPNPPRPEEFVNVTAELCQRDQLRTLTS